MQHFITLYDVAYQSFKTFRTNLAWAKKLEEGCTKLEEGCVCQREPKLT
jgi:hypothetical protein